MLNNHPIDEALKAMETAYEIDLVNKLSGAFYANASVLPTNTMAQILQEYASDIGIDPKKNVHFENKRTGTEITAQNTTVENLGLKAGDVLAVWDDGNVA